MKVDLNRRFKGFDGNELNGDNRCNSDGTYVYNKGVDQGDGASRIPNFDRIRFIVRDGIIVGYIGE